MGQSTKQENQIPPLKQNLTCVDTKTWPHQSTRVKLVQRQYEQAEQHAGRSDVAVNLLQYLPGCTLSMAS